VSDSCCGDDLLNGPEIADAARELGVRGFLALWRGERRPVAELTTNVAAADALAAAGRVEVDEDGVLVAVHGLVARPTTHRIEHADGIISTWCAFDAVGIPVALGIDASAVTTCPHCGTALRVPVRAGEPDAGDELRLWMPAGPCTHLVDDFCRHANLYCNGDHLASVVSKGSAGRAIDVRTAGAIGRATWRDVATLTPLSLEDSEE
jgi:Alkylmercury lyase